MWSIETAWFDVALIMSIFAVGNVLLGRFEEHRPRWRRMLKLILVSAIFIGVATGIGRGVAVGLLVPFLLAAVWIHVWWLPGHGINGWTAEPYDKYLELVTGRSSEKES